jgi:DNA invertase Pin-like site-specific DNA recombinase
MGGKKIGYARVSTDDQDLAVQLEQLQAAGCDKIFSEKVSGANEDRRELNNLMDYVREDDVVVVCKLDRVARSTQHLLTITKTLEEKGVAFQVLNIALDTSTATGKLMLVMLAAIAEFERSMMLERQRDGIRHAKAKGAYKGRQPTARAQLPQILDLLGQGMTKVAVAKRLQINVSSVYRLVKDFRQGQMSA